LDCNGQSAQPGSFALIVNPDAWTLYVGTCP
jgi:hypothetical protein